MGYKITEIFAWIVEATDGDEGIPAATVVIGGEPHFMPMIGADRDRMTALEPSVHLLRRKFPNSSLRLCRFTAAEVVQTLPALGEPAVIPPCPVCGETMESMINLEGNDAGHPEGGDLTVCGECGTLLIFETEGGLRRPDHAEVAALIEDDPDLEKTIGQVAADLRTAHNKRSDH